ncbi:MAG TPA: Ig-like domain-containing protein [Gemmatimonadota bacterium]|nr:Ig-like domain-containing protein [Gemmatimonadota bacterium]
MRRLRPPAWAILAVAHAACASEGFPPGGPEDRAPPVLVETRPADRAVNATPDQVIRLTFDEQLDPALADQLPQLIVVNPSPPDFDYTLDGDGVILTPQGPLIEATTYIVTVLPGLADRDGNRTVTPRSILFSVGGETPITLSLVRATVVRDTVPVPGARFLLENQESDLVYRSSADSSGRIDIEGVAFGPYVATAWEERVRPVGWQMTEEPGARDTFELGSGNRSHDGLYRIAVRDTTPPNVLAVATSSSGVLSIRTDDPMAGDAAPPLWAIHVWEGPPVGAMPLDSIPLERLRGRRLAVSAVERAGPTEIRVATAEPLRKDRWYRVELVGVANAGGLESTADGGLAFRPEYAGPAVHPSERIEWPGEPPPGGPP